MKFSVVLGASDSNNSTRIVPLFVWITAVRFAMLSPYWLINCAVQHELLQYELFDRQGYTVLTIGRSRMQARNLAQRQWRVGHHHAGAREQKHFEIVEVVADSHYLFAIHTQLRGRGSDTGAFRRCSIDDIEKCEVLFEILRTENLHRRAELRFEFLFELVHLFTTT